MKAVEPGHVYRLDHLESSGQLSLVFARQEPDDSDLTFIRRNSAAITHPSEHPGTNVQEVLRALIDRSQFLDSVVPCAETEDAIYYLRMAFFCYEARAWRRKQQKLNRAAPQHNEGKERYDDVPFNEHGIELRPVGPDGHILLSAGKESA